ncbi:MAG: menaquinone biosynthesis protein [Planctomycetes bacterium]|nr:menaquinone biosynthesis protein [Planctomycetota bacterium]
MLRYGSVPYLNARPLLDGLAAEVGPIRMAVPSELVKLLRAGEIDVAMAPVVAAFEDPSLCIVPGAAVAAHGPVESVLLFCRKPPVECAVVGLDTSSRTSAALVRVLFQDRWKTSPTFVPRAPDPDLTQLDADAALLIGDPALQARWVGPPPVDLAAEWNAWTGLPFVFAAWLARDAQSAAEAEGPLRRAAARGKRDLDELADDGARDLHLDVGRMRHYLHECLSFDFDATDRAGLERFRSHWAGLRDGPGGAAVPKMPASRRN